MIMTESYATVIDDKAGKILISEQLDAIDD